MVIEWTSSELLEAGLVSSAFYSVFQQEGVAAAMRLTRPPLLLKEVSSYKAQDEELQGLCAHVDAAKMSLSTLPTHMRTEVLVKGFQEGIAAAETAVGLRLDVLHSEARAKQVAYFTECSSLISNGLELAEEFKRLVLQKVLGGLQKE